MAMNKETRRRLDEISEDLMELIDRLEELSQDEETLAQHINPIVDSLSRACDALEEME